MPGDVLEGQAKVLLLMGQDSGCNLSQGSQNLRPLSLKGHRDARRVVQGDNAINWAVPSYTAEGGVGRQTPGGGGCLSHTSLWQSGHAQTLLLQTTLFISNPCTLKLSSLSRKISLSAQESKGRHPA